MIGNWLGTLSGMLGALLFASNLGSGWVVAGYVAFILSSIIWGVIAVRRRDHPLFWMQAAYVLINAGGLARWAV